MSARKTERLLNLVICLLATRRFLPAERIRRSVPGYGEDGEAFKRMFERDKEELRELGIPLETGTNSVYDDEPGYRIARSDYELPEIALEPDEAAAVGLAARVWQSATLGPAAASALLKLRAAGVETDRTLPLALEPRVDASEPAFAPLLAAVRSGRRVRFGYHGSRDADLPERRVDPWGVVSWHGNWYLVGHDLDRDATRVFRLSRITGAVQATGPAGAVTVPEGVDLTQAVAAVAAVGEGGLARLRVRSGHGDDLRREAQSVTRAGDVDIVTLRFSSPEWLAQRVAGYGADVVVEDPPAVREAVVRRLRAVATGSETGAAP